MSFSEQLRAELEAARQVEDDAQYGFPVDPGVARQMIALLSSQLQAARSDAAEAAIDRDRAEAELADLIELVGEWADEPDEWAALESIDRKVAEIRASRPGGGIVEGIDAVREAIGEPTIYRDRPTLQQFSEADAAKIERAYKAMQAKPRPSSLDGRETQETIYRWMNETFPGMDPDSPRKALRALEEMVELCVAMGATIDEILLATNKAAHGAMSFGQLAHQRRPQFDKVPAEAADVLIVLFGVAGMRKFDLSAEVDLKMKVNRARKWRANGDGTGYHIKETSPVGPGPAPKTLEIGVSLPENEGFGRVMAPESAPGDGLPPLPEDYERDHEFEHIIRSVRLKYVYCQACNRGSPLRGWPEFLFKHRDCKAAKP